MGAGCHGDGGVSRHQGPQGHCFVLGDNRGLSLDSRKFGFVPLGDILGRAEYIYFPARDWSRFGAVGK